MNALASYVHVTGPDGVVVALAPGAPVPGWAVPLITNPKAWVGGVVPEVQAEPVVPAVPVATSAPAVDEVKVPPRRGAGSGRDAWAAYAADKGVEVTADLKNRDDIIAACELAGIPVE